MSPSPDAPEHHRPALLAAAVVPPWPVRDGYSLRVAHLLEQLADRWRVTVVSPAGDGDDQPGAPTGLTWRPVEGVPATTALPWRPERTQLADRVEGLLAGGRFAGALLWSGTEFLAEEVRGFPPAVVDRIDCETLQVWRNLRDCGSVRGLLRLLRRGVEMALYERRVLSGREGVAVTGPDDARALRLVTGNRGIEVLPNGVDLPALDELPDEGDRPRVIFTGTMSYGPNITAVRWFAREVWPTVLDRAPEAEFVVAGRRPSPEVRALAGEGGIVVHPDVPDLTAEIRRAWVAVAPMQSGSGIKNKVLEAWAAGRPAVLSELATNGLELEGEHGDRMRELVCREPGRMAEVTAGLLEDRRRRRELGQAARALAEERHSWEVAGDQLHHLLSSSLSVTGPVGNRPSVSLVIATLGRPERLQRTLASVARLEVPPGSSLEVLVVDNGPSARTRAVVEGSSDPPSGRIRYLAERAGGAARARNRGVAESRGDLIAFTDDDCLLEASWLAAVLEEFDVTPRPDVLGGRVELDDPRDARVSIRESREKRVCEWTEVFSSVPGCNFCVRRPVFAEVGRFDERLGPGTPLRAAEDADFLYRAHRAGCRVVYSPRPAVRHAHGRRTREEVAALQRGYVLGRGGFYCKHVLRRDPDAFRLTWWELRECLAVLTGSREPPGSELGAAERIGWLARGAWMWITSLGRGGAGSEHHRSAGDPGAAGKRVAV